MNSSMNSDIAMKEIQDITDLEPYAGQVIVVEFGWNSYKSGVGRLWKSPEHFQGGSYGYPFTAAVSAEGVHSRSSITDKDIVKGTVRVRLATAEEIANAVPSYRETWAESKKKERKKERPTSSAPLPPA